MDYFHQIFSVSWIDVFDILLVSLLIYQIFKIFKDTNAIKILLGITVLYLTWKIVSFLGFNLLGEIIGNFINVGVLLLIIVFQPEIRKFLLYMGSQTFISRHRGKFLFWHYNKPSSFNLNVEEIVDACASMSSQKIGALIVLTRHAPLMDVILTGYMFDAEIKSLLLQSIFFKNSPLHDGAVVIRNNKIIAARCTLPLPTDTPLTNQWGMRHRAAIGVTENSDALAIVVSEQTGNISLAANGQLHPVISVQQLKDLLHLYYA
ncbi:MAG: diadenylate cyclase CdaA [Bacteroidales bacterium]|nr:diadenylate cyclase CdaA [Bacteroidales bacterium]